MWDTHVCGARVCIVYDFLYERQLYVEEESEFHTFSPCGTHLYAEIESAFHMSFGTHMYVEKESNFHIISASDTHMYMEKESAFHMSSHMVHTCVGTFFPTHLTLVSFDMHMSLFTCMRLFWQEKAVRAKAHVTTLLTDLRLF